MPSIKIFIQFSIEQFFTCLDQQLCRIFRTTVLLLGSDFDNKGKQMWLKHTKIGTIVETAFNKKSNTYKL